jgi:hypothetical protein
MMGIEAPGVPKAEKAADPGKDMVELSDKVAAFYGYGKGQPVKRETKRILESSYRQYFKPSDKGTGKDTDDPLTIIGQMRKRSQAVFDKGVLGEGEDWREGIGADLLREYQSDLQQIEQDFRAGLLSKAEARMKAVQLGTFDQFLALHGGDRDETTAEIKEFKEGLLKELEN